jgi:hypothetical protein
MYVLDWQDFTADVTWFVKAVDVVDLEPPRSALDGIFAPTSDFSRKFPGLTELLRQARVTRVRVNSRPYHLYGWTNGEGQSLGWLCLPPSHQVEKVELHPDHRLLLSCFGGVTEQWNEPETTWLLNLKSALCEAHSQVGIGDWESYYLWLCEEEGLRPCVEPSECVSFAFEANGNRTVYQSRSSEVLMFAHDHYFSHIVPVPGCPEYTFYTIRDCPDLQTWVEIVARQWLADIARSG